MKGKRMLTIPIITGVLAVVGGRAAKKMNQGKEFPARAVGEAFGLVALYGLLLVLGFVGTIRGRYWVLEIPFQLATSKSSTPLSRTVGTSGR